MRRLWFGLAFLIATAAITACTGSEAQVSTQTQQPATTGRGGGAAAGPVPIEVGRSVRKSVPRELRAIGTVEASSTVAVHGQTTGQLTSVGFKEGDDVAEGQVLFTLDRGPLEAALAQAEANLQRDTAQAANAKVQADRLVELQTRGIATKEQVETARANTDALNGTLAADRAAVDNARIQLEFATIAAPISGRTGTLMVHAGNLVRANDTTPLVVINKIAPVNVSFAIPESQLAALKQYMGRGAVSVEVEPPDDAQARATGRVTFVDNSVDQATGTIKVKGSFPNKDQRLWPGAFVNVVLTLVTDPDAIVVPTTAVQSGQTGQYVFVVKNGQAELRPVKIRRTSGNESIIADGLAADEVVVTDGQLRLVPGSRVTIKGDSARSGP